MEVAEFFVRYVQRYIPTFYLRFIVRWYIKLFAGWQLRRADVVVQQIVLDRLERRKKPVTSEVEVTNEQLYANDPSFFQAHLGPMLKYSACEWPAVAAGAQSLARAEEYTVAVYQQRAGLGALRSGARVLELGCGWGSLTLANAQKYPHLHFVAFSNSPPQIEFIRRTAAARGLQNLSVYVEDYAVFVNPSKSVVAPAGAPLFDAAVAIETIEHAQNIGELLGAVARRLVPGGTLFVQSLLHQSASFFMDSNSWMGRNFFTGGSIISLNSYFHLTPPELYLSEVVPVNGKGYSRTLLAWLALQEQHREWMVEKYGSMFYEGFRMFYIACAEAFAANDGAEYMCGYYTFVKR